MLIISTLLVTTLATFFVLVSLLMMAVVLIQKPRGGGLSGAFGGAGGSAQSAFGAKTGDFLTWLTVGFFVTFLLLAIGLTWAIHPTEAVPVSKITSTTEGKAPAPPAEPVHDATPAIPSGESQP